MTNDHHRLRLLTAVPICDGHDSAINTINLELVRAGIEVIYLGYHRPVRDIVRAAIQEGVAGVGLSSYNGGHVEFFSEVVAGLRAKGAEHIGVFGGGGGTISHADAEEMRHNGVERIFFPGTLLEDMTAWILQQYGTPRPLAHQPTAGSDLAISQLLNAERGLAPFAVGYHPQIVGEQKVPAPFPFASDGGPPVIGVTGPGGAGKTTLIDELVLRFLKTHKGRVAILSHDPSIVSNGALLGDRATMIHSQNDRVFMRSLATRGQAGGLGPQTAEALAVLRSLDFELIFVETVGTGQEAMPFRGEAMKSVFVMSPEYGSRLQLQKIAMLDLADIVVVNKNDRAGAVTARNELEQRVGKNRRIGKNQRVMTTCAKRHRDAGVDALFAVLVSSKEINHE